MSLVQIQLTPESIKNNAIAVGFNARGIHVVCNDEGLRQLPPGIHEYHNGGGNLHNGVFIAITESNLVALRLIGVLSERDLPAIRRYLP